MPFEERRKYPRVPETVSCRIRSGPDEISAPTLNLSCGGILCRFPMPLPVMTQLRVSIELPPSGGSGPVRCRGVVVRRDEGRIGEGAASYLTAVYFSKIRPRDRRRIAEFVLQSMLTRRPQRPRPGP